MNAPTTTQPATQITANLLLVLSNLTHEEAAAFDDDASYTFDHGPDTFQGARVVRREERDGWHELFFSYYLHLRRPPT